MPGDRIQNVLIDSNRGHLGDARSPRGSPSKPIRVSKVGSMGHFDKQLAGTVFADLSGRLETPRIFVRDHIPVRLGEVTILAALLDDLHWGSGTKNVMLMVWWEVLGRQPV